jgi:hypothetical protein
MTGPDGFGVAGLVCLAAVAAVFLSYLPPMSGLVLAGLATAGVGLILVSILRSRNPSP